MSKINKLGKSTFVIAILSFLLVAVLAFGGTYAYFHDVTNTATGDFTTGTIQLTDLDETAVFTSETDKVVPGAQLTNDIKVTATVNVETMLIAVMSVTTSTETTITASHIVTKAGAAASFGKWDRALTDKTVTDAEAKTKTVTNAFVYNAGTVDAEDYSVDTTQTDLAFVEALYLDKSVTNGSTAFENQNAAIQITVTFYAVQYNYLAGNGVAGNYETAAAAYAAARTVYADLPTA